ALAGFSMGGSIILKYLGVHGSNLPEEIIAGVAVSTPCHLETCSERLDWGLNRIYRKRFLDQLIPKIIAKEKQYPGLFDLTKIKDIKKMRDFDEFYSAPANGLSTADEFYKYGSSIYYMDGIKLPTLLLNANNDPILSPLSYPVEIAEDSDYIFLEIPKQGGHVGFSQKSAIPWHEVRLCEFLGSIA
ncbi:MAG: alpha/beta fold hydrolase, partial [Saprospiraceae bacterium]